MEAVAAGAGPPEPLRRNDGVELAAVPELDELDELDNGPPPAGAAVGGEARREHSASASDSAAEGGGADDISDAEFTRMLILLQQNLQDFEGSLSVLRKKTGVPAKPRRRRASGPKSSMAASLPDDVVARAEQSLREDGALRATKRTDHFNHAYAERVRQRKREERLRTRSSTSSLESTITLEEAERILSQEKQMKTFVRDSYHEALQTKMVLQKNRAAKQEERQQKRLQREIRSLDRAVAEAAKESKASDGATDLDFLRRIPKSKFYLELARGKQQTAKPARPRPVVVSRPTPPSRSTTKAKAPPPPKQPLPKADNGPVSSWALTGMSDDDDDDDDGVGVGVHVDARGDDSAGAAGTARALDRPVKLPEMPSIKDVLGPPIQTRHRPSVKASPKLSAKAAAMKKQLRRRKQQVAALMPVSPPNGDRPSRDVDSAQPEATRTRASPKRRQSRPARARPL